MNFVEMILYFARLKPHKYAIIEADRAITYTMLARDIRSVARSLSLQGLTREDLVAIVIPDRIRHITFICALHRLGIASVSFTANNNSVRTTAVVTDAQDAFPDLGRRITVEESWFDSEPAESDGPSPGFETPDSVARILTSSGTTAGRKPVAVTAQALEERIVAGRRASFTVPWDRMLCLYGISSSAGYSSILQALVYGHSLLFADHPATALQFITAYDVDLVVGSPAWLRQLVAQHIEAPVATPSLKLVRYSGAAIDRGLVEQVRARLCSRLVCQYSSTETGLIAYGEIGADAQEANASMFVAPWVEAQVIGQDGEPGPFDTTGRLRFRTRFVGRSLRSGEPTDEWCYTGDVGRISETGRLHLLGRDSDGLTIDGTFVSPDAIEEALMAHPGIRDVAVVPMPTSQGGQEFWAAVVPKSFLDFSSIRQTALERNALFRLAEIRIVDRIARNEMGKIQRPRMREILSSQ